MDKLFPFTMARACVHQALLQPFFPLCPAFLCQRSVRRDAVLRSGGYAVLSPSTSISVHPCIAISSVSKGSFRKTAYGWPLPVKANLCGALTNLCAQCYRWTTLCSSVRALLWISFPIRTDTDRSTKLENLSSFHLQP